VTKLTPAVLSRADVVGLTNVVTAGDASGMYVENSDGLVIFVKNGNAGATKYVDLTFGTTLDGITQTPRRITLEAYPNGNRLLGPFPPDLFGNAADGGRVYITPESSDVLFRAISVPPVE
jgi:hypothetical protein